MKDDRHVNESTGAGTALLAILQRQRDQVRSVRVLAQRQHELIRRGDTNGLLELLTERQALTDAFLASQAALSDATEALSDGSHDMPDEARARVQSLTDEITRMIEEVVHQDEQDQAALRDERTKTGERLAALDSGQKAREAYRRQKQVHNRFADQHG